MTLVLGPRGSGKTTLLRALARWAGTAPVARLDLAELARQEQRPLDVLKTVAFALEPVKKDVPRVTFPAFRLVCGALGVELDADTGDNRAAARRRLGQELTGSSSQRLEDINQVAQVAVTVAGLPAALSAPLQLLPLGERGWLRGRLHHRLAAIRRATPGTSALDFLIELNLAYHGGSDEDRRRTERFACEVFLSDLRRSYTRKDWAIRCLVLLDNVDNRLGGEVLRLLLTERRPGARDPLVLLAMAGSYPEALRNVEFGWQYADDGYPGPWAPGAPFAPPQVADGLCVAQLRDLARHEVEQQAKDLLQSVPAPAPRGEAGVRWLGWAVHELTRGQPEGTARVLAALGAFESTAQWERRLRGALAPGAPLVPALLERLLPIDPPQGLREMLTVAAAGSDLAEALVTRRLRDEAADPLRAEFHAFCRDRLRTMRMDAHDTQGAPGPLPPEARVATVPHPLLRRLLLAALDDPIAVHIELRAHAEDRGEQTLAAYHALAAGDLPAAAAHLDETFEQMDPQAWCATLCRLRRAPLPPVERALADSPWRRYESLVHHLGDDSVGARLRTVTRLLAASWIAPEPPDDPATDRIGDPYREPLGDPYASLYAEINARFHTLATAHTQRVAWTAVLLDKAEQYTKEPWR